MLQKNKIITILSALLVLFTFSSCHEETELNVEKARYDVFFKIYVKDAAGNNLLNPNTENHIPMDDVRIMTNYVYSPVLKATDYSKRYLTSRMSQSYGIYASGLSIDDKDEYVFCVTFLYGDVPIGEKKMDIVTIRWGDGTSDTFSYIVKANSEKDLTFSYYINGEPNYGDTFFITKR